MNRVDEIEKLAVYLEGAAAGMERDNADLARRLRQAAGWLELAAENVCGLGYFGCGGGRKCQSDHK